MLGDRASCWQFLSAHTLGPILIGIVIATIYGSRPAIAAEEAIPNADQILTQAELRWCRFEPIRIDVESSKLNQRKQWEVNRYNDIVRAYNNNCGNKSYRETDGAVVESELTSVKRELLRQTGALRLLAARADRDARRMYVKEQTAIIRNAPNDNAREAKRMPRWGDLIATGKNKGPWYEVEWSDPSLDNMLLYGWVFGGFIERGSGILARFEHCESIAGQRAKHNEIVEGRVSSSSTRDLVVNNGTGQDAYVKLIDDRRDIRIAFFVAKGLIASITGIPMGSYELVFGTGKRFSRGCKSFSEPGSASKFSERLDFESNNISWKITLHTVMDGNAQTLNMSYDNFDML